MSGRWETVRVERRVLAVARTVTSLNRVLEVVGVFADDPRVQLVFVVSRGSRFGAEVPAVLEGLGVLMIDWQEAVAEEFDLVIAASDHDDLHELRGPLVLLPHGAGFQKYSPYAVKELAGLTRSALWHEGEVVPEWIGLSHENQRVLVPELADRTFVAGDPAFDTMTELRDRRERTRSALGLEPRHKLVTVTSTWGPSSLLARWPTLPAQLMAELPWDEYRVAVVLHPNIWAAYSPWQVRHWLRTATTCGLILIPPTGPWQLGLAAADAVVGDQGSLSVYAAGLGLPLLMGGFDTDSTPDDSAVRRLSHGVPWLDGQQPLAAQIRDAISGVDRSLLQETSADVFAAPGRSLYLLQEKLYDVLRLDPTVAPVRLRLPDWRPAAADVRAFHVEVTPSGHNLLGVDRFPAALAALGRPLGSRYLIAFDDADEVSLQNASAIVTTSDHSPAALLDRYPGCRAVFDGFVGTEREGRRVRVVAGGAVEVVVASAVWLHRAAVGDVEVRIGAQEPPVGLRFQLT
ncbi:hypothetical protein GCM10009745_79260 [Kribbella yunnanensis]|uniref:UDP-N-acetylglucosamine 2-epimerase domain-containing protein n=1 Tax=Kribbella yunnanensis TaxID=190194 RepID=A0ABP4V685_9ACTN